MVLYILFKYFLNSIFKYFNLEFKLFLNRREIKNDDCDDGFPFPLAPWASCPGKKKRINRFRFIPFMDQEMPLGVSREIQYTVTGIILASF